MFSTKKKIRPFKAKYNEKVTRFASKKKVGGRLSVYGLDFQVV